MAHRRDVWTLIRSPATAAFAVTACAVALTGCGSTPDGGDGTDVVPLPRPADLSRPPGTSGPGASDDDLPAADSGGAERPDTPSDAAPATAPEGPARWVPGVGTVVRLAGISPRDLKPMTETRRVRAGGDDLHLEIDVEVTVVGGPEEDVARETYLVSISDEEIRVSLAPDPLRQIPDPARELPREPVVGQTWNTPAGHCRVEAVLQDVTTFVGTRSGCVRVRVTSPTGRVTFRWFDPLLGEIRREVLDLEDRILAAWALCGAEPPPFERCREVLLEGI